MVESVTARVTVLENHFGFEVDDSEFSGEFFDAVGSLTEFVEQTQS
jgi:acyl carrier protein